MKKKILSILTSAMLTATMVGCSSTSSSDESNKGKDSKVEEIS